MADRFFLQNLAANSVVLSGQEAHHALHVMRLKAGNPIQLFDGRGGSAEGIIRETSRADITIDIQTRQQSETEQERQLIVAASPPKGDRLKWMVEKLTEVGVHRFIPLQTERSVVDPRKTKLDKLTQTVISACKQSGRNRLMDIDQPQTFADLMAAPPEGSQVFIAHPSTGENPNAKLTGRHSLVLVGPEGGFTVDEVSMALDNGAEAMAWPDGILRTDTAAIVFAALLTSRITDGI